MSDPIEIEVSQSQPISVSVTSPSQVGVNVSGGVGPQGPAGPTGPQGPPGDSANLPAGNDGDVLTYSSGEWVAAAPAGAFLPLAGGAMNSGAVVTLSNGTTDSEVGGWGFGVELTGGNNQFATVEYNALTVQDGSGSTVLGPGRVTLPNSTQVTVGSFDNMTGGANGISLICSVGYELNWQGGRIRSVQVGGDGTPQTIYSDSPIEFPGDGTDNVAIDSNGLTFADGSTQTTAAVPLPQALGTGDTVYFNSVTCNAGFVGSTLNGYGIAAGASPGGITYYNDGITFADSSFQNTAWTGSVDWATQVDNKPTLFSGSYADLSGKPTLGSAAAANTGDFAAASHTHALSSLTQSGATSGQVVTWNGSAWSPAATFNGSYTSLTNVPSTFTPSSHAHGNITNAGAIGSASGQIVVTTLGGVLTTAASISSGAVSGLATIATSGSASDLGSGTVPSARLPAATTGTAGAVIVGTGLSVSSGTISVTNPRSAVNSDTVGATSYLGQATPGSATSASVWKIRKTVFTSSGTVSSTTTATNVRWDDRLTATYS